MKPLIITTLVLLIAVFGPVSNSMGAEGRISQSAAEAQLMVQPRNQVQKADTDPNAAADPNAAKESQKLDRTLSLVERQSSDEVQEWTKNTGENRVDLAKAVQKQVETELKFIRRLAVQEGCGDTAEAIKRLLVLRRERFAKLIKDLQQTQTRRPSRVQRIDREQTIDPLRGTRGRDSDMKNMSGEERRRAWEQRRREQSERRRQERESQRSRTPQSNIDEY
ncbi:MAG: hypothetical protein ACYS1A_05385 [Planctomycetota bacterium]|jgi:hypothetical protein